MEAIERFGSRWWSTFRKKGILAKLVIVGGVSLLIIFFLCNLPLALVILATTPYGELGEAVSEWLVLVKLSIVGVGALLVGAFAIYAFFVVPILVSVRPRRIDPTGLKKSKCPSCGKSRVPELEHFREELRSGEYREDVILGVPIDRKVEFVLYTRTYKCPRCERWWTEDDV